MVRGSAVVDGEGSAVCAKISAFSHSRDVCKGVQDTCVHLMMWPTSPLSIFSWHFNVICANKKNRAITHFEY